MSGWVDINDYRQERAMGGFDIRYERAIGIISLYLQGELFFTEHDYTLFFDPDKEDSALTIDEVQQEAGQEVGEKIDEKNKELDQIIDERADKISNELTVKGQELTESVSLSAEGLTRLLEDSVGYFDTLIEGGITSLNQGLDEERKALQSKADDDAGRLRNEVRDILIREIKEYSEQSEYVIKSFFFDAIFSDTPICGIVEGLDSSTGWISLNTKMNFSPLNNQISTLKFSMAAILRHFQASESEHHATFSNINTAYRSGQLFCVSIYFRKDTITSWVEYSESESKNEDEDENDSV